MTQLPLGTASRQVCQKEEELIYWQQFLGEEKFNVVVLYMLICVCVCVCLVGELQLVCLKGFQLLC